MATEDQPMNPYDPPVQTDAAAASKISPRSNAKRIVLAVLYSVLLGLGLTILLAFVGRGIALATFESNPNDLYESRLGIDKARAQHVVAYSLNFAIAGFFVGVLLPWIYLLYSWFRKTRLTATPSDDRQITNG